MPGNLIAAGLLAGLLAFPAGAAGPHSHRHHAGDDAAVADRPPPPAGFVRTLEDETRAAAPGRVAWSTYWKLCWDPVATARHYEIRLVTSEGAPRTPKHLVATCYRIEAAAGENPVGEGMPKRELMLSMQAAQAALQVRAVFADGRATAWSTEQPIGDLRGSPR